MHRSISLSLSLTVVYLCWSSPLSFLLSSSIEAKQESNHSKLFFPPSPFITTDLLVVLLSPSAGLFLLLDGFSAFLRLQVLKFTWHFCSSSKELIWVLLSPCLPLFRMIDWSHCLWIRLGSLRLKTNSQTSLQYKVSIHSTFSPFCPGIFLGFWKAGLFEVPP